MRKEVERLEKFQLWLNNAARDLKEKEDNELDGIPNEQLDRFEHNLLRINVLLVFIIVCKLKTLKLFIVWI